MTRMHPRSPGHGFTAQMAPADFLTFTRWHDRRCLVERPTLAECQASLSVPDDHPPQPAAQMRDAA